MKWLLLLPIFASTLHASDMTNLTREMSERVTTAMAATRELQSQIDLNEIARMGGMEVPQLPGKLASSALEAVSGIWSSKAGELIFREENIHERGDDYVAYVVPRSFCDLEMAFVPQEDCEELTLLNLFSIKLSKRGDDLKMVLRTARPFSNDYRDIYALSLSNGKQEHWLDFSVLSKLVLTKRLAVSLEGQVKLKVAYATPDQPAQCYYDAKGCFELSIDKEFSTQPINIYVNPDASIAGPTVGVYLQEDNMVGLRVAVGSAGMATPDFPISVHVPKLFAHVGVDAKEKELEVYSLQMSEPVVVGMGDAGWKFSADLARPGRPAFFKLGEQSVELIAPLINFMGIVDASKPGLKFANYFDILSSGDVRLTFRPQESDEEHKAHEGGLDGSGKSTCAMRAMFRVDEGSVNLSMVTELAPEGVDPDRKEVKLEINPGESFHFEPN